ncbi:AAA family ATPase [Brevibacillus centrosporus]|uniref:nucleotide-binding protein n=1 Tax=Brevibacillus centrosporus TaxID=54910 RepID=UPI003D25CC46
MQIALERIDKPDWLNNEEYREDETNGNVVVAVIGGKGGIGKSTLSFYMAALAADDHDVALVDMDLPSANLTKALLLKTEKSFVDFERIPEGIKAGDVVCAQKMEKVHGIHFLPGVTRMSKEARNKVETNVNLARKLVNNLSNSFSLTFFDLGVPSNDLHYEILRLATHVVCVTDESRVGVQASNDILKDLEKFVRIKHKTKYIINAVEEKKKTNHFNVLINYPILGTVLYQPQVKKVTDTMQYETFLSSNNKYLEEIREVTKIFNQDSPENFLSFYQHQEPKAFHREVPQPKEPTPDETPLFDLDLEYEEEKSFWKRLFSRKKK